MLNPHQEQAVFATQGRLLVLAGAGSGKTRVIVHRIAHLMGPCQTPPQAILGLTFTNKAAAEMRQRLSQLIPSHLASQVTLATFHSFCMQVLRREIQRLGYTNDFSLYDERDMERVVRQLAREILGHEGPLPSCKGLSQGDHPFAKEIQGRLPAALRAYNAVSFDHLIQLTVQLFETHPDVLARYQAQYRYLMIDEYQDTNPMQFHLAELLAKKEGNLCVVGDDDQSIYGWRGARVNHILDFKADRTIALEQNYRSTPTILAAANAVIQHNQHRHKKTLWSRGDKGELIEVFNAASDAEEAAGVIDRLIHWQKGAGWRWKDMAILYRSNALSRQLELALMNASWQKAGTWVRGIPYEVFGGLEFSERSEIKDLLAYLRVIVNPKDQEALLRILNVPRRGISDEFLDEITKKNRSTNTPLWHLLQEIGQGTLACPRHPRGVAGISAFLDLIQQAKYRFAKPPLAEGLIWLLEAIHYKKAIEEEVKSDKMRAFKWDNVQECVSALAQYEQETSEASLSHFVANTALAKSSFAAHMKTSHEDRVQLMTLHSAKGLEFPICFMIGLEDHILPHEKSIALTGLEEERRLFYVGITRAMKRLIFSMARSRMKMGRPYATTPSRFLFEIPKSLLKATPPRMHAT